MGTKPLAKQAALDLLHHCLEEGIVRPGKHFLEELADEDLDMEDARKVLQGGAIYDAPEHDVKTGDWKYKVEGYESGEKWIVIVFTFHGWNNAFLITIWSIEARRRR